MSGEHQARRELVKGSSQTKMRIPRCPSYLCTPTERTKYNGNVARRTCLAARPLSKAGTDASFARGYGFGRPASCELSGRTKRPSPRASPSLSGRPSPSSRPPDTFQDGEQLSRQIRGLSYGVLSQNGFAKPGRRGWMATSHFGYTL